MTKIKTFPFSKYSSQNAARDAMIKFIATNQHRYTFEEIFANNAYAVEYRTICKINL